MPRSAAKGEHRKRAVRWSGKFDVDSDDGNRFRRIRARANGRGTDRKDHIRLKAHRFCGVLAQPLLATVGETVLDHDVLALDVPEVAESLPEHALLLLGAG